jgi:hypothetical protein
MVINVQKFVNRNLKGIDLYFLSYLEDYVPFETYHTLGYQSSVKGTVVDIFNESLKYISYNL